MGKRTLGLFSLPMRVVGDVVLRLLHCGFSDFFHGFATAIQLRFTFFAVATFRDVDFKFTFCAAIHIAIFGSFHDSFSIANGSGTVIASKVKWNFAAIGEFCNID